MARLTTTILCDFAQVREGLLFVSSGGITRIHRAPEPPMAMGVALAFVLEIPPDEIELAHEVKVTVTRPEAVETVTEATVGLQLRQEQITGIQPGESIQFPWVVPLHNVGLPAYGAYDVKVSVDSQTPELLTFYVVEPLIPQ